MSDTTTATPDAPAVPATPVQPSATPVVTQVVATTPAPTVAPVPVVAAQPAVVPAPTPAAIAQTSVAPAQHQVDDEVEPEDGKGPRWLPKKLESTRKATLRALGIEPGKEDDVKKVIADHKARLEAEKTELQKAQERAANADALAKENKDLLDAVQAMAAARMQSLTPEQRAVVEDIAGPSPAQQLKTIEKLTPTWVSAAKAAAEAAQAQAAATAAAQAAQAALVATAVPTVPATVTPAPAAAAQPVTPPPLQPPATTASTSAAPASTVLTEPNILQVYQDMRAKNPIAAMSFRAANWRAIGEAEQKSRGA